MISRNIKNENCIRRKYIRNNTNCSFIITAQFTYFHLDTGDDIIDVSETCCREVRIPVHSLVLCLNSNFFTKLLHETSMKEKNEKEIVLHVDPGEGEYVELLIHSFYDFDLLKNIGLFKLLKVLEYGDRFMCDALLKQGSSMVDYVSVATIKECNSVLDHLNIFEKSLGHILAKDFFVSCCSQYLTESFTPLECVAFSELPKLLNFSSLLMLLKSDNGFAYHENSVFTFVLNWLETDESRQTEQNIEALLSECRFEHMGVPFLAYRRLHINPILCKWPGFLDWYIKAIAYPSSEKCKNQSKKRLNRSLLTNKNTKKSISNLYVFMYKPHIHRGENVNHEYNLKMKLNQVKEEWISDTNIMYKGYILLPALCKNSYILRLYLGNDGQKRELKDFFLKISFQVLFFDGDQEKASEMRPCRISNWSFPLKIKFDECNIAETLVDVVSGKDFNKNLTIYAIFVFNSH